MKPAVLITRPRHDALKTAEILAALGYEPILSPVLEVSPLDWQRPDWASVDALVCTSANALPAFAREDIPRNKPLFVVGQRSYDGLLSLGYKAVYGPCLQSSDMPALITKVFEGRGGRLLHLTAAHGEKEFYYTLRQAALTVDSLNVYDAQPVRSLDENVITFLKSRHGAAVLFFSPRSARLFIECVRKAGYIEFLQPLEAFCLSPAVAAVCQGAGFKQAHTAAFPTQTDLLDCLAKWFPPVHS